MLIIAAVLGPLFSLAWWLGPWADAEKVPAVERSTVRAGDVEAWVFAPPDLRISGALLVCPGLHYAGPADPRFLRFASVLANAGILVYAPFLPDFLALRVDRRVVRDLELVLDAMLADPRLPAGTKPGMFSISFGSLPVLLLAARRREVGAVVIFGGYADFANVIRFSIGGERRDPLNLPVVFMNLIDTLGIEAADQPIVLEAWREYVQRTWGRPEMKLAVNHEPIAAELVERLPERLQRLFFIGLGLAEGAEALAEAALARRADQGAFLDPRPELRGLSCEVHLVHGLDDDVIPYTEMALLAQAMPGAKVETYLTGLYGHTGGQKTRIGALVREIKTLWRMLRALVRASRMPAE